MKTSSNILAIGIFILGFGSCTFEPPPEDPVDIFGTPINSSLVYDQLSIDWESTEMQNVNMVTTGGSQEGRFQQFDFEISHLMFIRGKVVRWNEGTFTLNDYDDNGISGVYKAVGIITDEKVSIEIDFFLTGGCGDFCNASGQMKGVFTNSKDPNVYELLLEGTVYQDLRIGR